MFGLSRLLAPVVCAATLMTAPISYAADNMSVIGRIQKLLDNPKTWQQIPQSVNLCVYSPEGARGKNF
jgi:hypothetical protein